MKEVTIELINKPGVWDSNDPNILRIGLERVEYTLYEDEEIVDKIQFSPQEWKELSIIYKEKQNENYKQMKEGLISETEFYLKQFEIANEYKENNKLN